MARDHDGFARLSPASSLSTRLLLSAAVVFTASSANTTSDAFGTSIGGVGSLGVLESRSNMKDGRGSSSMRWLAGAASRQKPPWEVLSSRQQPLPVSSDQSCFRPVPQRPLAVGGRVAPSSAATVARRQRGGATVMSASPLTSLVRPDVLGASARAVAELFSCCLLGVMASKLGILGPVNVNALSKIVYGMLLPALLMTNVAKTCVSQPVASLLPIPFFAVVQIGIGLFIARFTMRLLNVDGNTEEGRETKVCSGFQNSGILPLSFLGALLRTHPDPAVLTRGVAYVSFYLMGWSPTFWTVANGILTGHLREPQGDVAPGTDGAEEVARVSPPKLAERAKAALGRTKESAKKFLSPPIVGCIAGLAIGVLPPLQWVFMGPRAPLAPLWAALTNLATAYTPAGVLVLAGSLANCPPTDGALISKGTVKTIASVALVRWMLMPAATAGLLLGGLKLGVVPQDPMLLFVLLMESFMPPAQNSVIMLQVAGLQDAAGRNARTLCTIYLISILPVSLLLTIVLSTLKLV